MPRTEPTKTIGVYGKYDIPPEQAVESYVQSKLLDKIFIQPPNWNIPRAGLEIESIQNEREFAKISEMQHDMRLAIEEQATINGQRIEELDQVQQEVRDRIITVNEFIRDCEGKESDAAKKIAQEKALQTKLQEDIAKYEDGIQVLSKFHETLEKTVEEFRPYEEVILDVVAESDIFNSVEDLMTRCDALMLAQLEISEMQQEKIRSVEQMRLDMVLATDQAAQTVMGLNNTLFEMERCYNAAKAESLKWERVLARTKNFIADNEMTTDRMLDAIQQLYTKLCNRAGDPVLYSRENPEEMLDYIKEETEILQEVVRLSQERMEHEKNSLDVGLSDEVEQKKKKRKPKKAARN